MAPILSYPEETGSSGRPRPEQLAEKELGAGQQRSLLPGRVLCLSSALATSCLPLSCPTCAWPPASGPVVHTQALLGPGPDGARRAAERKVLATGFQPQACHFHSRNPLITVPALLEGGRQGSERVGDLREATQLVRRRVGL